MSRRFFITAHPALSSGPRRQPLCEDRRVKSVQIGIERETAFDPETTVGFAQIYEASFPPSERDDTADLVASIEAGERLCLLARRDREVVGLAVVFDLQEPAV